MGDELRPVARARVYEQVIERLRAHVDAAGLRTGDRLPPERQLAERLGVSRSSVAQATMVLEVQGLVEVRQGGGVYLRRDTLDIEPVADLVARKQRLPDILDARDALETKLAELAAARHTEEDRGRIDSAMAEMRRQVAADEAPMEGDRLFHAAVATAAHSQLLSAFYEEIQVEIGESRAESLRQPGRPRQSLADHERIAAAIRARNPRAAAAAMHRHVDHVSRVRLLAWDRGGSR
ncbi:MAG: FadR/GntR family transcriptional regulator [Lapillicoccus sp.]